MTIICVKDGVIAADRMEQFGNQIFEIDKLFAHDDGDEVFAIAAAGNTTACQQLTDWYCDGADPDEFPLVKEGEADVVALHHDRIVTFQSHGPTLSVYPVDQIHAYGSGREIGRGAMEAGASAEEAAEITCRIAPGCGLGVDALDVFELNEKYAKPKKKRKSKVKTTTKEKCK